MADPTTDDSLVTARRLALAWATGASLGLLVGYAAGQAVRTGVELRQLRREAREAEEYWATVGRRPGPHTIAAAMALPTQRHTSPGGGLPCQRADEHQQGHGCQYVHTWAPDGRHDDNPEDD